ncbi:MAG: hypothetical protein FRX48_04420 [Lasallia pustulata]|uniref:Uncharacterized protein n=1 Tax=Lasallia pustulata TaxID=136370 RepID=A0A5M8PTF8_9LECA|nr:MAG: hypothetical protein FRX48_04420 [Lasallia pustulata]
MWRKRPLTPTLNLTANSPQTTTRGKTRSRHPWLARVVTSQVSIPASWQRQQALQLEIHGHERNNGDTPDPSRDGTGSRVAFPA